MLNLTPPPTVENNPEQNSEPAKKIQRRPPANIFQNCRRRKGLVKGGGAPHLPARRALYLGMHAKWRDHPKNSYRLTSIRRRAENEPDWKLYQATEIAMLLFGHKIPEKLEKKPKRLEGFLTSDREAMALRRWIRDEVKMTAGRYRGRKSNPDTLFKTALAAAVARRLVQPMGGNWTVLPSPREISQIWYVLYGEHESHESIKSRLPLVGRLCVLFGRRWVPISQPLSPKIYPKLGKALVRKYPQK